MPKSISDHYFFRCILLALQQPMDDRTLGATFFDCCDELADIDLTTSLQSLLDLMVETLSDPLIT